MSLSTEALLTAALRLESHGWVERAELNTAKNRIGFDLDGPRWDVRVVQETSPSRPSGYSLQRMGMI